MVKNLTFFEPTDLPKLAGLIHEALWEAGFNLDDMDFGIVSDHPLDDGAWIDKPGPYYEQWLLDNASRYCIGYYYTQYAGKHWYTIHHA